MSRKSRKDKSAWHTPSVHVFTGGYGPYKPRQHQAIENALVLLSNTIDDDTSAGTNNDTTRRHPMYKHAAHAQKILLQDGGKKFQDILVVDIADMIADDEEKEKSKSDVMKDLLQKENTQVDLVKGYGKTLLRMFQRLDLRNAVLMAEGELCPILLKLYMNLGAAVAKELWLVHPTLPADFVNTYLVPMGNKMKGRIIPTDVHLIFCDEASRDKRVGMVRHVFSNGTTQVLPERNTLSLFNTVPAGDDTTELVYDPDFCNAMGESFFMSSVSVEMSRHTKQYVILSEEITSDLLKVITVEDKSDDEAIDMALFDFKKCEQHAGALVLRGNRCVLARSLKGEWKGMRIPSLPVCDTESIKDTAMRAVVKWTGVEAEEVRSVDMISPITVYAPNGRQIVMQMVVLYETDPPDEIEEEEYMDEDAESQYDWYTLPNATERLDQRSIAALRSLSYVLNEAGAVGVLPNMRGGIFGQEMMSFMW